MQMNLTLLALSGVATDANGTWMDASRLLAPFSVQVSGGGAGDTVIVNGSCSPTQPINTAHESQLASITADGITVITGPVRWIKARKPAATISTSVFLSGFIEK